MPTTATFTNTQNYTIPEDVYSMRIRIYGGSGGGEFINNDAALTPTAGTSGGSSSFLGMTAGGGVGGGIGGRNLAGDGGTTSLSYNWGNLGATITSGNGARGDTNTGGVGFNIAGVTKNGGDGTPGLFSYTSYIYHEYSPIAVCNYVNNSSADLNVGYLGGEGTSGCGVSTSHKYYHVNFNVPFTDATFEIKDPYGVNQWESNYAGSSWCAQAAGGSTSGPFYPTSGPNSNQNTLIYTQEYGWLSFRNDSLVYQHVGSFRLYTHWSSSLSYSVGSFVVYGGIPYRASSANTNVIPPSNTSVWQQLTNTSSNLTTYYLYNAGCTYTFTRTINVKKYSYFNVWMCRAGGSTYVRCINFLAIGKKEGAVGRGGGGGSSIETTLTRDMLLGSGSTYAPGTTHTVTVGGAGSRGGNTASNGVAGLVDLYMYIIPRITLTASRTEIANGESVTLTWSTSGDADSITWSSGGLTNGNLSSEATVSPTLTRTYTATASGLGGTSPVASITITVYQRPTASISAPLSLDYGVQGTVTYETEYANTSITVTPTYSYDNGVVTGDPINITPALSAEYGVSGTTSSGSFETSIPYNNYGPRQVQYTMVAVGSGGSVSPPVTLTTINIDETPENINVPETEDVYKEQDPIVVPEYTISSDYLQVLDIDIPVEIKSDKPIKVDINQQNNWQDLRQL